MVITHKTLMYMGKSEAAFEDGVTPYQEKLIYQYQDIVKLIKALIANNASAANVVSDEIESIVLKMEQMGMPAEDLDIFYKIRSATYVIRDGLTEWLGADVGTSPWDLEDYMGLPSGSLSQKSYKEALSSDRFDIDVFGEAADALSDFGTRIKEEWMFLVTKYGYYEIDRRLERLGYSQAEISNRMRNLNKYLDDFGSTSVTLATDLIEIVDSNLDIWN